MMRTLPLIRNVYQELAIQRMASTMSSLMKAGLPIVQTINIAAETVGLDSYRAALLRIANDGLTKGPHDRRSVPPRDSVPEDRFQSRLGLGEGGAS